MEEMGREIEKAAANHDEAGISVQLENLRRFVNEDRVPTWK
jgi:hypothetical protein